MKAVYDIIIIGGGLAGLTSAIHLSREGMRVLVIEKHRYPRHKVCGEYLSREVLPYLRSLDADPFTLQPVEISRFIISAADGQSVETHLPLGGLGISRYALDNFLMQKAVNAGCTILYENVINVFYENGRFHVEMARHNELTADLVLGAYGKRAVLHKPGLPVQHSPWLAVKGHYEGDFPEDLVALHTFDGGYCGVSRVEKNKLNVCYLVHYDSFKPYKNIAAHQHAVLFRNPFLRQLFENSRALFTKPLSISQISFAIRAKIQDHILMLGDAAGLLHPLCGNGMAMAILGAKVAAESIQQFVQGKLGNRPQFEQYYTQSWNKAFRKRMLAGKLLSGILQSRFFSEWGVKTLRLFPDLLPLLVRQTHGRL
jgi:flavin-dependent dehydrogenase